jgi:hypothetical protein
VKRKKASIVAAAFVAITLIVASSDSVLGAPSSSKALDALAGVTGRIVVQMKALNGSGENGTATFSQFQKPKGTVVIIVLQNGARTPQPTHIHAGSCPNPNRDPVVALHDTVLGSSKNFLPGRELSSFLHESVVVHKSLAKIGTYVSCGNIR